MIRIINGLESLMSKSYPTLSSNDQNSFIQMKEIFLCFSVLWMLSVMNLSMAQSLENSKPLPLTLDDKLIERDDQTDDKAITFTKSKTIDGVNERNITLKENAEIRKNSTVLKGDVITYDIDTDIATATGNALLRKKNSSFKGPKAQLKLDAKEGWIEEPVYEFRDNRSTGSAQKAEFLDKDRTYLTRPTYTTCSPENLDWYFSSSSMLVDQEKGDATGDDGVLHFFDTPIIYAPYFSFPLGNERRSGFLTATMGLNSNSGFDVTTPYYVDIAPNRDLTIYPRFMTKRGAQIGGEYRYLEPSYSGTLIAEYLPNDAVLNANRWAYTFRHQQLVSPGLNAYANISRVSDDFYADDLARTQGQAISRQYNQEAGVNYSLNGWNYLARVQKFQTLQPDPNNLVLPPYDREPELSATFKNLDYYGTAVSFVGNLTRFTYSGPLDPAGNSIPNRGYLSSDRAFVNTSLALPYIEPGYYLTPKLSFRANSYSMQGNSNYPSLTQSFTVPTLSLDSGMFFERDAPELKSIFGKNILLTIEPRILYVYTPYVDQSQIPLFDTASAGFGIAQIFSENTFVGNDRVADNNKITAGFTTKILESDTGVERIRGTIAQRFDMTGQKVGLNGNQTAVPSYSDLLIGAATRLDGNINLDAASAFSQDLNRSVQSSVTASWRPAPRKMLNASYRYNFDPNAMTTTIYQYELSGQWPIMKSLYGIGRWNFDKVTGQTLNSLAGVEYDQDCWVFRVALNRFVNTSQVSTTQIFFQIEFKGLSGFGNNPISIMQLNIPGYIPVNEKPLPLSRFESYD